MVGRPRQFNETEALESAMEVFWRRGYEAAGMSELLEAMQISRQSCYNTFGEKRELFLKAIQHYGTTTMAAVCDKMATSGSSPLANVRGFLEQNANCACETGSRGCLVVNAIVEFGDTDATVAKILRGMLSRIESTLEQALQRAQDIGEISSAADPASLAKFVTHVGFGFSALGKIKLCKDSSAAIVDYAMSVIEAA